jgi:hypothetical protein
MNAGQRREDLGPGGAQRIDEVEMASAGDRHEPPRAEQLTHGDRHGVIGSAVNKRDGNRRRGQRGRVGYRVAFGDLVGPAAH